jgi:glyoxylase-like metal-dependent hydrolase (beta-lactamase superfamily II)
MATTQLTEHLHLIDLGGWQSYLWRDEDGVTLIDAGPVGSGPALESALGEVGATTADVRHLVLTHFHDDHAGGAAEVAGWGAVEVVAHRGDAPVIRGEQSGPPPRFTDAERALHAQVAASLPPAPPCRVDREVTGGEVLDIAGGALVVAAPGHTDGSLALFLQVPRVLFTGDTIAEHDGAVMRGVFNLDGDRTAASFRALAELDSEIVCFGHGRPVLSGGRQLLTAGARQMVTL